MNRYNNGKIYAIRSNQTDKVYIGSTCDTLPKRLYVHRNNKKRYEKGKYHYVTSYEMLEFDDAYIDLVEEFSCANKMQLERREGEIMRATENTVNRNIAGRTKAEYYRDNIVKMKEYTQRPEVKQKMKEYQQRPEVKQKMKEYQQRPEVKQKKKERHECLCGSRYTTANKAHHLKTKKHKEYVEFMALTEEQVRAMI
jgi:hypothetical protein